MMDLAAQKSNPAKSINLFSGIFSKTATPHDINKSVAAFSTENKYLITPIKPLAYAFHKFHEKVPNCSADAF